MMSVCRSPFLIWFTGRTGSTYLCDLLNSHPQIHCRREDFCEILLTSSDEAAARDIVEINGAKFFRQMHCPNRIVDDPSKTETLEYLSQLYSEDFDACGLKMKHPNQFVAFPEVVKQIQSISGMKLIGLQRINVLKQAVSLNNVNRLRAMGIVDSGNSKMSVNLEPIELNVSETTKHARFFERCKSDLTKFAEPFEHYLSVNYEDLLERPLETQRSVLEYLEIESDQVVLHTDFKKVTPDKLSDAVANYDQLVDAVVGTALERYLD